MTRALRPVLLGFAAILFAGAHVAYAQTAEVNCEQQISQLSAFSEQLREDEKRTRSAAEQLAREHPLVVKLEDGRIVNLSGEAELSKPLESWLKAIDTSRKAETDLESARKLLEALQQENCLKLLEPYRFNRS